MNKKLILVVCCVIFTSLISQCESYGVITAEEDEPEELFEMQCVDCSSEEDSFCKDNYVLMKEKFKSCSNVTAETMGCYLKIDGDVYLRGCASELDEETLVECSQTNYATCKICDEDNCNRRLNFQLCKMCESTSDRACIRGDEIESQLCDKYDDSCLVYVVENGKTVRGCRKTLLPLAAADGVTCPSALCHDCTSPSCNKTPFPGGRLTCHQCTSGINVACPNELSENRTYVNYCQNYDQNDKCFLTSDEDGNVLQRGCISSLENKECSEENNCIQCDGADCNFMANNFEPELSCIQCESDDPKCAWGYDSEMAVNCTSMVVAGRIEQCYTYKKDNQVSRGCVQDKTDECDSIVCSYCDQPGCNNFKKKSSICYWCDSLNEGLCESNLDQSSKKLCDGNEIYEYRGCFTIKTSNRTRRGCIHELTVEELHECEANTDSQCTFCTEEGCNSGASTISASLSIGLIVVLIYTNNFTFN